MPDLEIAKAAALAMEGGRDLRDIGHSALPVDLDRIPEHGFGPIAPDASTAGRWVCQRCGALLYAPSWAGNIVGWQPFAVDHMPPYGPYPSVDYRKIEFHEQRRWWPERVFGKQRALERFGVLLLNRTSWPWGGYGRWPKVNLNKLASFATLNQTQESLPSF